MLQSYVVGAVLVHKRAVTRHLPSASEQGGPATAHEEMGLLSPLRRRLKCSRDFVHLSNVIDHVALTIDTCRQHFAMIQASNGQRTQPQ